MSYDDKRSAQRRKMHYSPNLLAAITNGIESQHLVSLEYDSREKGISSRTVEPMAIVYKSRKRHLVGWCRLREDWRTFRLDRIAMIKVMGDSFTPKEGFNADDFSDDEEYTSASSDHYDDYDDEGSDF